MKKILLSTFLALFIFLSTYPLHSFAQEPSTLNLPQSAKARLGKGWISELKYSPDGTRLAVATAIGIWLYNTQTYEEVALLTRHTEGTSSIVFSSDNTTLASGSWDGTVHLWNVATGEHQRAFTGHTDAVYSVAFGTDNLTLASGSADGTIYL